MKSLAYLVFLVVACAFTFGQAQYKVLYSFGTNGAGDGAQPWGKLVSDKFGNLYGTTVYGGNSTQGVCVAYGGCGTAFELSPNTNGSYTETVLYNFCSLLNCADGAYPAAGLIVDSAGNLFGTTAQGAVSTEYGAVFELSPPSLPSDEWTEQVIWAFGGNEAADGCLPESNLIVDSAGSMYGTTTSCGAGKDASGTVFELTPSTDGTWAETLLHTFRGTDYDAPGGRIPIAGVTFDRAGNLYGTTSAGGKDLEGILYELSPKSGGGWMPSVLHSFSIASGAVPLSTVSIDQSGNLYGTLSNFGSTGSGCVSNGCGGIFRTSKRTGSWATSILPFDGVNGGNPAAGVFLRGNKAYGAAQYGGASGQGTIFAVRASGSTVLYDFCSQANCTDGSQPKAALLPDRVGNFYGVTTLGGEFNQGVVFEITP